MDDSSGGNPAGTPPSCPRRSPAHTLLVPLRPQLERIKEERDYAIRSAAAAKAHANEFQAIAESADEAVRSLSAKHAEQAKAADEALRAKEAEATRLREQVERLHGEVSELEVRA